VQGAVALSVAGERALLRSAFVPGLDVVDAVLAPADLWALAGESTDVAVGAVEASSAVEESTATVEGHPALISDAGAESDGAAEDAGTACGGQSFTASTRVLLAAGRSAAMGSLTVGTMVLAADTSTGASVVKAVQRVWVNHDTDLPGVTVTDGRPDADSAHHAGDCQLNGVTGLCCHAVLGLLRRPSNRMSNALSACFQRWVQRALPFPVGSRAITAR
jgi:hypothetical protein